MQISNKMLLVLLVAAVGLVVAAVWLTLRPPQVAVRPPPTTEKPVVITAPPTVDRQDGSGWVPSGPTTVFAPDGMVAKLDCDGLRKERSIKEGAATFPALPTRGCALELVPAAPDDGTAKPNPITPFAPILPGDEVECVIDSPGGHDTVVCTNSLAQTHAATLVVYAGANGQVSIDGEAVGSVPVEGHRLSVGRHTITFTSEHAIQEYPLSVHADEFVSVQFTVPSRDAAHAAPTPAPTATADGSVPPE